MLDFQRIKDIREDHDISQEKMADILNVKRACYSLWELGINFIPLDHLIDFADYYDLSIDYCLGLSNDRLRKNNLKGFDITKIGNGLKALRISNNMSQKELASKLDISQACISKYEKGDIMISTFNLYLYSKIFNVSMNKLCCREELNLKSS